MEGSRQQRIVGGSNHFHGATFSSLCFNQRLDDDENGGDELRQNITEKHSIQCCCRWLGQRETAYEQDAPTYASKSRVMISRGLLALLIASGFSRNQYSIQQGSFCQLFSSSLTESLNKNNYDSKTIKVISNLTNVVGTIFSGPTYV